MNAICREIENSTADMLRKPQNRLDEIYPPRVQTLWFNIVNWLFVVAWLAVIVNVLWLFCHHAPAHGMMSNSVQFTFW
jgi:hypothetical protein